MFSALSPFTSISCSIVSSKIKTRWTNSITIVFLTFFICHFSQLKLKLNDTSTIILLHFSFNFLILLLLMPLLTGFINSIVPFFSSWMHLILPTTSSIESCLSKWLLMNYCVWLHSNICLQKKIAIKIFSHLMLSFAMDFELFGVVLIKNCHRLNIFLLRFHMFI